MAGFNGQWGYVSETTAGTAETVDTFLPVLSAAVKQNIQQLESQGIRAGRRVHSASKQGQREIGGTVEMELWNTDIATLFRHMFGAVAVATNASQWDYTFTPADLSGKSFTSQAGLPDAGDVVRPFTWAGCKIGEWTISADVGEIATLSLDIVAQSETNGTSLATASYDSLLAPFVFTEASLALAGSTNNTVKSFEVSGSNSLESRFRLGSDLSQEYLEGQFREYTGTVVTDFVGLADYQRFVAGDQAALVARFDNGTETLVFTLNVRFDGESPELSADTLLEQQLQFKAISATSDAAAITAVLKNAEGLDGAD